MILVTLPLRRLAAAVMALGLFAATPAGASSIGIAGNFDQSVGGATPPNVTLSFFDFTTCCTSGFFTGYEAVAVEPLPLVLQNSTTIGPSTIASYGIDTGGGFDGTAWKTYSNGIDDIVFNLTLDATWTRTFDASDGDTNYQQSLNSINTFEYRGFYILPASLGGFVVPGTGQLNASIAGDAQTFQIAQQAGVIPLPPTAWLLLGAVGVLGFMRVRQKGATA